MPPNGDEEYGCRKVDEPMRESRPGGFTWGTHCGDINIATMRANMVSLGIDFEFQPVRGCVARRTRIIEINGVRGFPLVERFKRALGLAPWSFTPP
jgi:hypothetical protein